MTKVNTKQKGVTLMQNALEVAIQEQEKQQQLASQFQEDIDPGDYYDGITVPAMPKDEQILLGVLDELASADGVQVRVYREIKGESNEFLFQPDFCDDLLGNIMETLQTNYGKGTYRIQARVASGQLKMNQVIKVGEGLKKPGDVVAVPVNTGMSDMMQLQMQMMQQSKNDMLQMFTMMQNSQTAMVQAMAGREPAARGEGLSIQDVLAMLPLLKGADSTEVLLKGIELGKTLAPDGNNDDGMIGLAKQSIAGIAEFARNMPKQQAPQPVQMIPTHAPGTTRPNPLPAPAPVQTASEPGNDDLIALVRILSRAAEKGGDPSIYAETVIDILGEDAAVELASDPHHIGNVIISFPVLEPHREWLGQVLFAVAVAMGLTEQESGDTVTENEGLPDAVNVTDTNGSTAPN